MQKPQSVPIGAETASGLSTLERARQLAAQAHAGQRYGPRPYTSHLDDVVAILAPYGDQAQILGYLHDIVEDTDVDLPTIRDQFGPVIADCVLLLTDAPGPGRRERKAKTNAKLARAAEPQHIALVVKAADRLANVSACVRDQRQDLLAMYRTEHDAFRRAVYRPGLCDEIWTALERTMDSGEGSPTANRRSDTQ